VVDSTETRERHEFQQMPNCWHRLAIIYRLNGEGDKSDPVRVCIFDFLRLVLGVLGVVLEGVLGFLGSG